MNTNKPFMKTGCSGLAVLAMSIFLLFIFPSKAPSLPEGFITPIIAFEFAQTQADIYMMFGGGNEPIHTEMVDKMNLGNELDYIYMLLYAMFLLLFSYTCAKLSKNKLFYIAVALALVTLAGDAMENMQLFGITANLSTGNLDPYLRLLHIFTWVKWGGLAVIFLVLSPWFLKGKLFSKIIGIIGVISFVLGVAAFLHRSMINEIFSLSVAIMFILMIIYSFTFKTGENV